MERTAEILRDRAKAYRKIADELDEEAFAKQQTEVKKLQRKKNDPLINKKAAIALLWFDTYESLKNWQKKVSGLGYLRFENKKILRSEVLRFRDDYYNGKLHHKLNKQPAL